MLVFAVLIDYGKLVGIYRVLYGDGNVARSHFSADYRLICGVTRYLGRINRISLAVFYG